MKPASAFALLVWLLMAVMMFVSDANPKLTGVAAFALLLWPVAMLLVHWRLRCMTTFGKTEAKGEKKAEGKRKGKGDK